MEIIAQAVNGVSSFLHPDYLSSVSRPQDVINFFDGKFNVSEYLIITWALTGILLLGLVIAHFVSIMRNRTLIMKS